MGSALNWLFNPLFEGVVQADRFACPTMVKGSER